MIDTHCHLDEENYEDLNVIINEMKDNYMIASGYDIETSKNVCKLIRKYNNIYGSIGIHPSEVKKFKISDINKIEEMISDKIVAIGEIGLDYYWDKDNKEEQKKFFIEQIKLAQKYNLPIVIHSRDAIEDTYDILNKYLKNTKAVLHCYSGSYEMAKKFIKLGVKFGIGGVLTFKNSQKLVEVVSKLDLNNFVLETDSPYLTPVPFRGKTNHPYYIKYVAEKIADIKGISFEEVINCTTETTCSIFDLNI